MDAKVQTVLGEISPNCLGSTLTHEHLAMDFQHFYTSPPQQLADNFKGITLDKVGYLRQYPYSSPYNLVFNDEDTKRAVVDDVRNYKKFGGGTIVENSTEGLRRDINFLKQVSQNTGVNIVAGTGYYIEDMQSPYVLRNTKEQLYEKILAEMTVGCVDAPEVKTGFIGEVASVWPLKELEKKAIKAAGEVQEEIGCGVSFHPHRNPDAPFEIIRLYLEAGGKAEKAVMSHLDRTLLQNDQLLEFAELNTYCQYDLFGVEVSYYQLNESTSMPSDAQRLEKIKLLVDEGKEDKILISHDIHTKHRLTAFGGHGYSHIINNVLPVMKIKGFSQNTIDKITRDNPASWLTISN